MLKQLIGPYVTQIDEIIETMKDAQRIADQSKLQVLESVKRQEQEKALEKYAEAYEKAKDFQTELNGWLGNR